MESIKNYVLVLLIVVTLYASYYAINNKDKYVEQKNLVESLNDTVKVWKDKDGLHGERQTITTRDPQDFLDIVSKDKEIQSLQKIVSNYKKELGKSGSVTLVTGNTEIDTIYIDRKISFEPGIIWEDSINNKWIAWDYKVTSIDSTSNRIEFKLKEVYEYIVINKEKSNGWFKKPTPYTEVVNKSPYAKNISQTTYKVINDYKPKLLHLGAYAGYGATLNSGIFYFGPQAGVGININF